MTSGKFVNVKMVEYANFGNLQLKLRVVGELHTCTDHNNKFLSLGVVLGLVFLRHSSFYSRVATNF